MAAVVSDTAVAFGVYLFTAALLGLAAYLLWWG